MNNLPSQQQQVLQVHASLIRLVVDTVSNPQLRPQLNQTLKSSAENGWQNLVLRIYKIMDGERSETLLSNLDDEDKFIIDAILRGIQNPSTLPDPIENNAQAGMAAPGIAHMIHQASIGNTQALTLLSHMTEQMSQAGGEMTLLAGIMKKFIDGERDPEVLNRNMDEKGVKLVDSILSELTKLRNGLN
ncbi:MAG: hypothetical protein V3V19_04395 [Cocleimonas sp.]